VAGIYKGFISARKIVSKRAFLKKRMGIFIEFEQFFREIAKTEELGTWSWTGDDYVFWI
jgi:hypothetical protein